jgi:hypothetical protein
VFHFLPIRLDFLGPSCWQNLKQGRKAMGMWSIYVFKTILNRKCIQQIFTYVDFIIGFI